MKSVAAVAGAALLLASIPTLAQDEAAAGVDVVAESETTSEPRLPGGFLTTDYLGFLVGYTLADSGRNLQNADIDTAYGVSALYGHLFTDSHWGYEINVFSDVYETEAALRTDYYRYGFGGDVTYSFGDRTKFTPFLLGGAGFAYNDVYPNVAGTDDEFDWFGNLGAGFVTGPLTNIGFLRLRGEARYVYDDYSGGDGDIRVGLGIEIPLLKGVVLPPPTVTESVQIVEVSTGLLDSDGDGVVDEKDNCPDTPAGTRVNGEGCPLEKIISLKGVTFEFNQARLRPDAVTILDSASSILKRYPDMNVEVAGHTDNVGNDSYNQNLSERRADAVRTYFTEQGVPASQMSVKGYGEAEPAGDNETEEGRELNRRVELRILN